MGHQYPTAGQGAYDYAPSVLQIGSVVHYYWCGYGGLTNASGQPAADIYYKTIDVSTGAGTAPVTVLGPSKTAAGWDNSGTCSPSAITGDFVYNGTHYSTAIYYSGTSTASSAASIGVAFTNNWTTLVKATEPVRIPTCTGGSGVDSPEAHSNGGAQVSLFYSDDQSPCGGARLYDVASTTDGTAFSDPAPMTTGGLLNNSAPTAGSFGYDRATDEWYLAADFGNATSRDYEPGDSYSFTLYRIAAASLFDPSAHWQLLRSIDTNATGYEINFNPGITRDGAGDVNIAGVYPDIQLLYAIGNPRTIANSDTDEDISFINPQAWDITEVTWHPDDISLPLIRYDSPSLSRSESTTGWVDWTSFHQVETLGTIYEYPTDGADTALYGCRTRTGYDYFASTSADCDGQKVLGINGYIFGPDSTHQGQVPLYQCFTGVYHLLSKKANCEGYTNQGLLGFALKTGKGQA